MYKNETYTMNSPCRFWWPSDSWTGGPWWQRSLSTSHTTWLAAGNEHGFGHQLSSQEAEEKRCCCYTV